MTRLYLIAGEASGDVLGARLIVALRQRDPSLEFAGVGGDRMAEQGFVSLFPMGELALMGLLEVLPNIRRLARRLDQTVADIAAQMPAAIITIDSPGFTLRVAARAKKLGLPIIHYVAPQIWGWREGRAKKIAAEVDHILALLPFEAPFFEAHGIKVDFVGHPVLESGVDQGNAARFRARHGLGPEERLLLVMPGSRRTEVSRLLPIFGAALALLPPGIRAVVPLAGPVEDAVRAGTAQWSTRPILISDIADKHDAFAACEVGLIKSGTSSLEAAVAGLPHVVAYRMNPITAAIVRRLVRVPFASLVNLLAGREVVPELIQEACTPANIATLLRGLLGEGSGVAVRRVAIPARLRVGQPAIAPANDAATQRAGFAEALARLRPQQGSPSAAAADAVLAVLTQAKLKGL